MSTLTQLVPCGHSCFPPNHSRRNSQSDLCREQIWSNHHAALNAQTIRGSLDPSASGSCILLPIVSWVLLDLSAPQLRISFSFPTTPSRLSSAALYLMFLLPGTTFLQIKTWVALLPPISLQTKILKSLLGACLNFCNSYLLEIPM